MQDKREASKHRTLYRKIFKKLAPAFKVDSSVFDETAEDPLWAIRSTVNHLACLKCCYEPFDFNDLFSIKKVKDVAALQMLVDALTNQERLAIIGCRSVSDKLWALTTACPVKDRSVGRLTIPLGIGSALLFPIETFAELYGTVDIDLST